MYHKIPQAGGAAFGLLGMLLGLAFAGSVCGLYCQKWHIYGRRGERGWDLNFDFSYFYLLRYKALKLDGVTGLSLSSTTSHSRSSRGGARLNTLSAVIGEGGTDITHLVPYGLPQPITEFIERLDARLKDPAAAELDETLVFDPLKMRDPFLYVFGGFFALLLPLTLMGMASMLLSLAAPAFISAGNGRVEYRRALYSAKRAVPFSEVAYFETGPELLPEDVPGFLRGLAEDEKTPGAPSGGQAAATDKPEAPGSVKSFIKDEGLVKLPGARKMRRGRSAAAPTLIMNLRSGGRMGFYGAAPDAAGVAALAAELNRAAGVEPPGGRDNAAQK